MSVAHCTARPAVTPTRVEGYAYAAAAIAGLVASGVGSEDALTWLLEVIWVMAALPLLALAWQRFPLTRLLTVLLLVHGAILMLGGHYTYAKVPLGFWLQETFGFERNHYDRLGHFAQGFVPAILARELLLRLTPLERGGWLAYLCVAAALSFSAFFELIEWWSALIWGADADAFLATQGDVWDTQWDMFLALCGAISALSVWSRWHDRQLGPAIVEKRP